MQHMTFGVSHLASHDTPVVAARAGAASTLSSPASELVVLAAELIKARRTVRPRRLEAPGPDAEQLDCMLAAAAAAPDHGEIVPWRFMLVPAEARSALADVFERSLVERDNSASAAQRAQAREKAFRAPILLVAIADRGADGEKIPAVERFISAGCAIQNVLLMATAMGFGSALTSGLALRSAGFRTLFSLAHHEEPLCFLSVGTATRSARARVRPSVDGYVTTLSIPISH